MPAQMIDTHCHLDVPAFADDVDAVVARAIAAGVIGMLVPAIRPAMWPALGALVERHYAVGMRLAIGIHPQIVPELAPDEIGGIGRDSARKYAAGSEKTGDRPPLLLSAQRTNIDIDSIAEEASEKTGDRPPLLLSARRTTMDIDAIAEWIAREARAYRAVAIGECGLDRATADMPRQELFFRAHIRAARITGLPLVIHVLRAHDLAPRILREELAKRGPSPIADDSAKRGPSPFTEDSAKRGPSPFTDDPAKRGPSPFTHDSAKRDPSASTDDFAKRGPSLLTDDPAKRGPSPFTDKTNTQPLIGVLHSYSGGAELVDVYRELGLAFSFAGPVSYKNARKPIEAARVIPDHLLMVETDAPDQAPEGHRGGRSEPAFVAAVIKGLAAARAQTAEEVAALTTANARRLFRSWE